MAGGLAPDIARLQPFAAGLSQRLSHIGGAVDITSRIGEGTLVSLLWVGHEQRGSDAMSRRRVSEAVRSVLRVEMFLFQAVEQFRLWTGRVLPVEEMRPLVSEALCGS